MNNKQLAELYVELALKYEEQFPVECGFAAATSAQALLVEKIASRRAVEKRYRPYRAGLCVRACRYTQICKS